MDKSVKNISQARSLSCYLALRSSFWKLHFVYWYIRGSHLLQV